MLIIQIGMLPIIRSHPYLNYLKLLVAEFPLHKYDSTLKLAVLFFLSGYIFSAGIHVIFSVFYPFILRHRTGCFQIIPGSSKLQPAGLHITVCVKMIPLSINFLPCIFGIASICISVPPALAVFHPQSTLINRILLTFFWAAVSGHLKIQSSSIA